MNNRFGVDVSYFSKELKRLEKSLQNRTRDELHRYLVSLAKIVEPHTIAQQTVTGSQKAETLTQIAEYIQRFAITVGQYLNDEYEVELNDIARQLRLLS